MKNFVRKSAVVIASVAAAGVASADVPAAATAALTQIGTDGTSVVTSAYGPMLLITGGFVVFGLVKKAMKRSA